MNEEKKIHYYKKFVGIAEQIAKIASEMDALLDEYNKALAEIEKGVPPLRNPIYSTYQKLMDIASDVRISSCRVACQQANASMMERILHQEIGM